VTQAVIAHTAEGGTHTTYDTRRTPMTPQTHRALAAAALLALTFGATSLGVCLAAATARADAPDSTAAVGPAGSQESEKPAEAKTKTKTKAKKVSRAAKRKGSSMSDSSGAAVGTMPVAPAVTPEHVQVQHILIGFAGTISGKSITRSKEEARKLAYEILGRARKGEDFGALVEKYTDDSPPGIYGMSGHGVTPAAGEYSRDGMVPAFGNVGFAISAGNIGIADYDPNTSPYGWHVIKRLK